MIHCKDCLYRVHRKLHNDNQCHRHAPSAIVVPRHVDAAYKTIWPTIADINSPDAKCGEGERFIAPLFYKDQEEVPSEPEKRDPAVEAALPPKRTRRKKS